MGLKLETISARGGSSVNRRESRRFPIHAEVTYKLLERYGIAGMGQTLDVASGGVAFTTENHLPLNAPVEVSINWPARLNDSCALKLVVTGRVVRTGDGRAAVKTERYVFRTRAAVGRPIALAATALAGLQRLETGSKPRSYAAAR
jgi:hypothetical protein